MTNKFIDDNSNTNINLNITDSDVDGFMVKLPIEYRKQLEKEYRLWYENDRIESDISEVDIRHQIINDLSFVSKMDVKEYTLYRKWCEIQSKYPKKTNELTNVFFEADTIIQYDDVNKVKQNIWIPNHEMDFLNLEPALILCNDNSSLNNTWNILRTFTSTQINNTNIGRNLYFIAYDKITGKYLGILAVSSDFLDLTPRDNYIGWSRDIKTHGRKINHTAIGSSIIPTQPLGYNYVGGKLMALLTISNIVESAWNKSYDTIDMPSKLIGMTTTSLYSSFSQYQNLTYWNKRGHSSGSIKFEPSKDTLKKIQQYLMTTYPRKYWEWYVATEPGGMPLKRDFKQRSLSFLYNELKIDKSLIETNHQRGIYFCMYYENGKEFLKGEISESNLIRRKGFDNSIDYLSNLWKQKYADKRIKSLLSSNTINIHDSLFYDDMITLSWEETKEKYITQVGR